MKRYRLATWSMSIALFALLSEIALSIALLYRRFALMTYIQGVLCLFFIFGFPLLLIVALPITHQEEERIPKAEKVFLIVSESTIIAAWCFSLWIWKTNLV